MTCFYFFNFVCWMASRCNLHSFVCKHNT